MVLPFLSLIIFEREATADAELPVPEPPPDLPPPIAPLLDEVLLLIEPEPLAPVLGVGTADVPLPASDVLLLIVPPASLDELPIAPLSEALLLVPVLLLISPPALLSVELEALLSVEPPPDALLSVVVVEELLVVLLPPLLSPPLLPDVCVVVVVSVVSSSPRPFNAYQAAPAKAARTMAPNTRFRVFPFSPSKRGTKVSSKLCSKRPGRGRNALRKTI